MPLTLRASMPIPSFKLRLLLTAIPFLLAGPWAKGEAPLFDATASRMLGLPIEAAGEEITHHSAPATIPKPVIKEPTLSLARPTVTLSAQDQKHFGPQSAGRRYDPRMIQAARIAKQRAEPRMTYYCWRYVKEALVESGIVDTRPETAYAKDAGRELCQRYGFVKLRVSDPLEAPVGAVIVYGGRDAGHVELRTKSGFASDFLSRTPYPRPLVGVYVKPG